MQCDTPAPQAQIVTVRTKRAVEWLAICCVALSCLVFVVSLGLTNLYRDGGWAVGAGSFVAIALSICWISKLEINGEASAPVDLAKR